MTFRFEPRQGLVLVSATLGGPKGFINLRLALDTGATDTLINTAALIAIGYDPSSATNRGRMTTSSTVESVVRVPVMQICALGQTRTNLHVLAHSLPPSAGVEGLLGLNFLRDSRLTIDFRAAEISLG